MAAPLAPDGTVAVIGAALSGLRAVQTFRNEGFVGRILLVGDEQHAPYDRPPLSKQVLAGTWPVERADLVDDEKLAALGADLRLGRRAVSFDAESRRVELDDGTTLSPDRVVLATGATPRMLPGTAGHERIRVLRTLEDCLALRELVTEQGPGTRVVIVGAGFIGSEVASTCRGLGCDVTVVEALATPLESVLGEQVGGALGAFHGEHGVHLRTGVGVAAIHPAGEEATGNGAGGPRSGGPGTGGLAGSVELSDGTLLPADVVVVGIGVVPNVGWLDGSGLVIDNGVVCDRALFAADGVVAAGDIARWHHQGLGEVVRIEHWQVAAEQGVAAARSLLAGRAEARPFDPVPYFWSDQYGRKIQVLGRPGRDAEVAVVDGSLDGGPFVAIYGRADRLVAAVAVGRPRQLMAFHPLLHGGATWEAGLAALD